MSIASDADAASEQYNLYRLLNTDEYISVSVTDIHATEESYYVGVTTTNHDTISVYILFPRKLTVNGDNTILDTPLSVLTPVFTERNNNVHITDHELHINPAFDTEANRSGDVHLRSESGTTIELEMMTALPESAIELTSDEKQALTWKLSVIDWYENKQTGENNGVQTKVRHRVDGGDRMSFPGDEVDDRFIMVSDEVIAADGQTTATFEVLLGEQQTTLSFCIPPDGRRPDIVSAFIEACGGTLDNVENTDIVLFPYGGVPEYVYEHIGSDEELLTTDDGLFVVVMQSDVDDARESNYKEERAKSVVEVVVSVVTIAVVGIIAYGLYVGAGTVNAFLIDVIGELGRNIVVGVGGFLLLDALLGVYR